MPSWIKKKLPTKKQIEKNPKLHWLSEKVKNKPYLYALTKHAVAGGVAVSLLVAFIPLPLEMLLASLLAFVFRVNLPIAILSTWLTNPITFLPANILIYETGAYFVKDPGVHNFSFERLQHDWWNYHKVWEALGSLGKAYLVGLPIVSVSMAILAYILIYTIWTLCDLLATKKK